MANNINGLTEEMRRREGELGGFEERDCNDLVGIAIYSLCWFRGKNRPDVFLCVT